MVNFGYNTNYQIKGELTSANYSASGNTPYTSNQSNKQRVGYNSNNNSGPALGGCRKTCMTMNKCTCR